MKNDPSPSDIRAMKAVQDSLRPILDKQDSWSEGEMKDVLFVYQEWIPARRGWHVPIERLRQLEKDSRTPEECQPYLQLLITQAEHP